MLRILLLADSHLGFDLPVRPRVERRRRGHDFLANHERALGPALRGEVDLVVHGGDVFHRSRVPKTLAHQAYGTLNRIAERIPVVVVPGNHERGRLPHRSVLSSRVHVFDGPRVFTVDAGGVRVALAGFPYERRGVRESLGSLVRRTGWRREAADVSLLCVHHCVEGATVGPGDFVFRNGPDVIRGRDVPAGFAAVFSGHIHRHQVLTRDLCGNALAAPVLYPGSIERTSLAEIDETKGFLRVDIAADGMPRWRFDPLPARPMVVRDVDVDAAGTSLEAQVRDLARSLPPDAVLRIRLSGESLEEAWRILSAARLRRLVPRTMNVDVTPRPMVPAERRSVAAGAGGQLDLLA